MRILHERKVTKKYPYRRGYLYQIKVKETFLPHFPVFLNQIRTEREKWQDIVQQTRATVIINLGQRDRYMGQRDWSWVRRGSEEPVPMTPIMPTLELPLLTPV